MQLHLQSEAVVPPEYQRLFGSETGLLEQLVQQIPDRSDPDIVLTIAERTNLSRLLGEEGITLDAAGKALDFEVSAVKAIGELAERYCILWPDEQRLTEASYDALETRNVVEFDYLVRYEEELDQLERTDQMAWTTGTNLLTGDRVFVPAEWVWSKRGPLAEYPGRFFTSSSGVAAHRTVHEAILNALYEIVERDAFMRTWLRRRSPDQVSIGSHSDAERLLESFSLGNQYCCRAFEMPSPTDVTVCGAAIVNEADEFPKFVLGGAADHAPVTALREAIIEAVQGAPYPKILRAYRDLEALSPESRITNFQDNVLLYARPEHFDVVEFLLEGSRTAFEDHDQAVDNELEACLGAVERAGWTPIAVDVTTRDVRDAGMRVVRTCVPEAIPLSPPSIPPTSHPAFEDETVFDRPHPYP